MFSLSMAWTFERRVKRPTNQLDWLLGAGAVKLACPMPDAVDAVGIRLALAVQFWLFRA